MKTSRVSTGPKVFHAITAMKIPNTASPTHLAMLFKMHYFLSLVPRRG